MSDGVMLPLMAARIAAAQATMMVRLESHRLVETMAAVLPAAMRRLVEADMQRAVITGTPRKASPTSGSLEEALADFESRLRNTAGRVQWTPQPVDVILTALEVAEPYYAAADDANQPVRDFLMRHSAPARGPDGAQALLAARLLVPAYGFERLAWLLHEMNTTHVAVQDEEATFHRGPGVSPHPDKTRRSLP